MAKIIFTRSGDFYEALDAAAKIVAATCGLVMTKHRTTGRDMCGIPVHSAEACFAELLAAGHQLELPPAKPAKNVTHEDAGTAYDSGAAAHELQGRASKPTPALADPLTHDPNGRPHPQYILDYIAVRQAAYHDQPMPEVWDRGNGWVNYRAHQGITRSLRPSELKAITADIKSDIFRRQEAAKARGHG